MKLSSVFGQIINKYKLTGVKELAELAEKGDGDACYELGKRTYMGKGVAKSYEKAREWFEKGAAVNHYGCCYELGVMLVGAIGGEENDERAAELFRMASDAGYVHASFELGVMYARGRGVKQNYVKAMRYLRKASQLPEASAMLDEAAEWWRPAAEARIPEGEYWYGVCLINGYGVAPEYETGYNWIYQAALKDHPKAIDAMVQIYEGGIFVEADKAKAEFWRKKYREVTSGKTASEQSRQALYDESVVNASGDKGQGV